MLLTKQLTGNVTLSLVGGSYEWAVISYTPSCNITITPATGTVVTGDVSTGLVCTVVYEDTCTAIIKLTITTGTGEDICEIVTYYDITNDVTGNNLTYYCDTNVENSCVTMVSDTPIFNTFEECMACATCPCNPISPCSNAEFFATYNCITGELVINSTNINDWCTNQNVVGIHIHNNNSLAGIDITIPIADTCDNVFPYSTILNPLLPDGTYGLDVNIVLDECTILVNTLIVNCGVGISNFNCCQTISATDAQVGLQGHAPRTYSLELNGIPTEDIIIDFYSNSVADKLSVYSTNWNGTTGTVLATTEFTGTCINCCNDCIDDIVYQGYNERTYTGINIFTNNNPAVCINGLPNLASSDYPIDYSFNAGTSYPAADGATGAARLILTPAFITQIITNGHVANNQLILVIHSNYCVEECLLDSFLPNCDPTLYRCETAWAFKILCEAVCDCALVPPLVTIEDGICSEGIIHIITGCEFQSTPSSSQACIDYSYDGITWYTGTPIYSNLPSGIGTLYVRCKECDGACLSAISSVDYNKPACCEPEVTVEATCNLDDNVVLTYTVTNCVKNTNSTVISDILSQTQLNCSVSAVFSSLDVLIVEITITDIDNYSYLVSILCTNCVGGLYQNVLYLQQGAVEDALIAGLPCVAECPTLKVTSNAPVCAGTTLQLTSTITNTNPLCTGITYSWTSDSLTPFTSDLANPTILNVDGNNAGTYILNVTYSSIACTNCILTDSVIVNGFPLPSIPTGYTNVSICAGTSTTLTSVNLNPCCNICTVNWYSALTGGTLLYTGVSYITPILNTTTTYYVTCESINGGCESTPRTPVVVTVAPCCTTTMSANNISTCLDTNGGILPVIYTFSTACTTSSVTANFINGWTYNSFTNEISYPPNTSPGTYAVNLDWICDTCFGTTTINVILNKPIVTAVPINNTCPTTSVSLYNAISTTPFVTINSGNTIFKTGAKCNSNGLLTGGITIPAITAAAWNTIGTTTIYYQYTDSVTNCKSCGSFVATVNACCNTTMTVDDVVTCLSPTGGTVNLVANYTPACLTGDIVSVTLPTPNWSFNPTNNSITYPANVAPNTYSLTATLNCGVCTTLYTFSFTINTATVTMQDIANDCNNLLNPTTVDLNDAIVTSDPLYTIVYRQYNILTNNTPICSSTGTLTGGLLINNPTSWTVPIGTTTIYYQYTNTATGCKKCGSFIVTGTTCCLVDAGTDSVVTICDVDFPS